jgi:hypothetical protein
MKIDNSRKISAIRAIKSFTIENRMYELSAEFRRIERDIIIENNRNDKVENLLFLGKIDKSPPFIDGVDQYLYLISLKIYENRITHKDKVKLNEFFNKIRTKLRDETINNILNEK